MTEHSPHQVPTLFYILAFIAMGYLIYNLRRLFTVSIGKAEDRPLNFFHQLLNSLSFGVGQRKVYSKRFTYGSIMHFLMGWGFMELFFATTVDFFTARGWLLNYLPGFDTPWFAALNDTGGIMLISGVCMALLRRHFNKPQALPHKPVSGRGNILGDTGILIAILIVAIGGFLAEAARLAADQPETAIYSYMGYAITHLLPLETWAELKPNLWWSHAIVSLIFIAILPTTKMFHAIAVVVNVALTNRKLRGHLRPMNVTALMEDENMNEDEISLGAGKSSDFTWKQLLDSVACTECSRCTTVCPAHSSGKLLSPMKIITDIRADLYNDTLGFGKKQNLINGRITPEELWACTTCGACMEECPVLIDHVPTITDMRRHLVLSEGKPPEMANESLEATLKDGNPWGYPKAERLQWATDAKLELPTLAEKKEVDVLYWVGCAGAYDPRNQGIARSVIKILQAAKVDFAVLGKEETCSGDSARRLGEEYLFETLANENISTLDKYKFSIVITACPHCFHTLSSEYPDFGGNYNVVHHSEFIQKLLDEGQLKPEKSLDKKVTYHDACYLGRHNDIYDAPRNVLDSVITEKSNYIELEQSKSSSFCCGAGGGNMWHEDSQGDMVNNIRMEQIIDSGAKQVATACSFCMIMLDDAAKGMGKTDDMAVQDIAEIIAERL
jgi:Fe-S oxidoreductase/nitrate reductase gamma subunit|tara:strand:- start:717 stop:2729 length:2013 start_codon:yes stop_codon:yes gene_type:complete